MNFSLKFRHLAFVSSEAHIVGTQLQLQHRSRTSHTHHKQAIWFSFLSSPHVSMA